MIVVGPRDHCTSFLHQELPLRDPSEDNDHSWSHPLREHSSSSVLLVSDPLVGLTSRSSPLVPSLVICLQNVSENSDQDSLFLVQEDLLALALVP